MAIQKVNITDVCSEIFAGGDAPKNRMSIEKTSEYTIPIYSNGEYRNGLYGYTDFARVSLPSITVSARGTIGYAVIRKEPFVPIVRLITVTPIPELIDIHYLYYAIKNFSFSGSGTSIPQLTVPMIKQCSFLLPTLDEQREIAVVLDKVSDLIAKRRQQLEKLDLLVKARFVEMFGDCQKENLQSLNDVCNFIDYRGKTPEKSERGIPLITAKNVKNNTFSIEPQEFIPEDNYESVMTRGIPQPNDVLFTTEAPMGNVCRIPNIYEKFCVGQRIITMQPHSDVLTSEYLEHILLSRGFQDKLWQNSSGSTVKGIRSKLLGMILIPIPSIEQQKSFSFFVREAEKTKISVKASLTKLEILKKALMQKYFG